MEVTTVIKILMIEEGYSTEEARKLILAGKPSAGLAPFTSFGFASSAC